MGAKYSIKMGPAVFIVLLFPGLGHYQKYQILDLDFRIQM